MNRKHAFAFSILATALFGAAALAQQASVTPMTPDMYPTYKKTEQANDYVRRVEMIPMRDGAKLYTVIVFRKGTRNGPILLSRTPYNAAKSTMRTPGSTRIVDILPIMDEPFVDDGYIRVYQDIRGRNGSEGEYVMNRPLAGPLNATGVDDATDA